MSEERTGVRFPRTGGRRSSSRTGADIIAASVQSTDPALAAEVRESQRWRRDYAAHFAASTRASAQASAALSIAEAGLRSAWERLVVLDPDGEEEPLLSWSRVASDEALWPAEVVYGTGEPVRRVEVPYRGALLHGGELEDQLAAWVSRGIVEPGFADAVRLAMDHPEWLPMPGHRVVLVGAGAALGPLTQLSAWGADVVALDVPHDEVWARVRALATAGSGSVTVPVAPGGAVPGLDVTSDLAQARAWVANQTASDAVPVLATHAYADGAAHVEVNLAADLLGHELVGRRDDAVLGYLNTPTDSFLTPEAAVEEARARAHSLRWNGPGHRIARTVSARRLFRPAYATTLSDETGRVWGLSDTLVDVQGPNYALAKRIQRWRAVVRHQAGGRVTTTVAPASWTTSVTKNRVLATVYAGAGPFGVEIFEPDTARALLAAKLVADVLGPPPPRDAHPEALFIHAAHGGLWRQPFEPRTALGVAALVGAPAHLLRRRH